MNWMLDNSHKVEVSSEEEGEEKAWRFMMLNLFSYECSASCCMRNWDYYKYRLSNTFYILSFIGRCYFYCGMFRFSRTIFRQYTYDFMKIIIPNKVKYYYNQKPNTTKYRILKKVNQTQKQRIHCRYTNFSKIIRIFLSGRELKMGSHSARQSKYKRLKLGSGHLYNRSSV
jgi:hypothetical protein